MEIRVISTLTKVFWQKNPFTSTRWERPSKQYVIKLHYEHFHLYLSYKYLCYILVARVVIFTLKSRTNL